ncbi:hypothetical protein Mal15_41930 [Stieleria maiorica]|uniref:Copper resistance protein D n=1 Tax=Stieleria maiorica TaxID=2795974 RepID=A0A5B9MGV8_9BACT|nr:hypothetical protein [Stieleria maiorica]QEG00124.1 hypothetical protein Mal15_41930 [Stieleria maiorica]
MEILDIVSRIVHVGTAITLVGGSVFTAFVLMPSAKELSDDAHAQLAGSVTSRWKRFVHLGVLLFLVSGFYNYFRAMPAHQGDSLYHALVGTKMLLALAVFFLAAALVGRSAKLQPIRDKKSTWIKVLVLLAAIIVAISGFVKVRGVPDSAPPVGNATEPISDVG